MQNKEVRVDLKVSRRESGLLQSDLANLLETTQPRISNLEQGKGVLSVEETLMLTFIFGKPLSELFRLLSERVRADLSHRLSNVPDKSSKARNSSLRTDTLNRLANRLSNHNQDDYGKDK